MTDPDCACLHFDRCECANMRYHRAQAAFKRMDDEWDPCDCHCHAAHDDEMDEEDNMSAEDFAG